MSATLTRRVARLESAPPPPLAPPDGTTWPGDGDPPAWWAAAPKPLRAYLLAGGVAPDDDADGELADLLGRLNAAADAGTTLPLVTGQARALWWRWCAVFHSVAAAPFRRFWGADEAAVFHATQDATGAALVALWRRSGTRALDAAALRLLDAREEDR